MSRLSVCLLPVLALLALNASAAPSCPPLGALPSFVPSGDVQRRDHEAREFIVEHPGQDNETVSVAGHYCMLGYSLKEGAEAMSNLEIQSNYRAQLAQLGAQITAKDDSNTWARLVKDGTETWLKVYSQETGIELIVIQKAARRQTLTAPSGVDYRLLGHMPGYNASGEPNRRNFDESEFAVDQSEPVKVQGKLYSIGYAPAEGTTLASDLDIQGNYREALSKLGAEILHTDPSNTTARLLDQGTTVWIKVYSQETGIEVTAVEEKPFQATIQAPPAADALKTALDTSGHVALYINFDFAKATLKPDAKPVIDQILALLKANPALKLGIEGHTDNVGGAAPNQKLSEQRAQAVVAALVQGGVAADRLSAAGYGAGKPLADNNSSEGRAKNRRVELVKR